MDQLMSLTIPEQQRHRRACPFARSHQSLYCSLQTSIERKVDEKVMVSNSNEFHILPMTSIEKRNTYEPSHGKACLCPMRTTKAQISLRIHSLISAFVVRCLDSIIPLLAIVKISRPWLVSSAEQVGWVLTGHKHKRQVFSWCGSYRMALRIILTQWQLFPAIQV